MAVPYHASGNHSPQTAYGSALALTQPRSLVPVAQQGAYAMASFPGISPVFDPHAFLPPMRPGEFDVQPLICIADLVGYIRKRWLTGLLSGIFLGMLAFAYLGTGKKIYQAEADLLLRLQGDNPLALPGLSGSLLSDLSAPMLMNNHRSGMTSRRFFEYVADHYPDDTVKILVTREQESLGRKDQLLKLLGRYKPRQFESMREAFIEYLAKNIAVEPIKESHILRVQIRDLDPGFAASLANRCVELYIAYVGEQDSESNTGTSVFLEGKSKEQLELLRTAEQKLAEYRKEQGIFEDTETKDVSSERVRQMNTALTDSNLKLTRARSELETVRAAQAAGHSLIDVKLIADNPTVAENRKQLEAKLAQRAPLSAMLGRRHPTMLALNSEVASLQSSLDAAAKSVVFIIEEEVKTQQRQIEELQRQLATAQGSAVDANGKNVQLTRLREDVRRERELYETIEQRRSAAALTGQFRDSGMFRLADRAMPPENPVKPNVPIAAAASLMFFCLSFIGLPIGIGLFNDHVRKILRPPVRKPQTAEEEIAMRQAPYAYTQAPQLQTVPLQALPATTPFSVAPQRVSPQPAPHVPAQPQPTPSIKPALGEPAVIARLPYVHSSSPESMLTQLLKPEPIGASSALHQLTGILERQAVARGVSGGIILITSAEPGEGKTLVAAALAAAFCHQNRSVFMMECNPSSPTLHEWFPRSRGEGAWAHDLEGLRYSHTNLFLLPGRDLPAHATNELLDGYRAWIDRARAKVDWIILDASPLLKSFANVAPLAPLATDVIVVSNPALTTPAKLRAGIALIQPMMSSRALRGMVINGA